MDLLTLERDIKDFALSRKISPTFWKTLSTSGIGRMFDMIGSPHEFPIKPQCSCSCCYWSTTIMLALRRISAPFLSKETLASIFKYICYFTSKQTSRVCDALIDMNVVRIQSGLSLCSHKSSHFVIIIIIIVIYISGYIVLHSRQ